VPKQRHEARFGEPITDVFNVLVRVLAHRRWGLGAPDSPDPLPKVGCRYARQSKSVLRRGRVLEVIRPVSLTLCETLHDPPCRVRLKLRWHVYPIEAGSLLRLNLRYELNGAATLRARHWKGRLEAHCARMLHWVAHYLELEHTPRGEPPGPNHAPARVPTREPAVGGQNTGKSNITAKITGVSGRPTLR
jgi:hypothetical protein